jgi:hypothetical protein
MTGNIEHPFGDIPQTPFGEIPMPGALGDSQMPFGEIQMPPARGDIGTGPCKGVMETGP